MKSLNFAVKLSLILLVACSFAGLSQLNAQEKEENLALGDLLYEQKEYVKAAKQYLLFIGKHPNSPNAQSAWFRLGECYLQVGQTKDAKNTFRQLVSNFKGGAYVGSGAYRLGYLAFTEKDYETAAANFKIASQELASPEAKHQSRYYYARSVQFSGKKAEAVQLYDEVIKTNPDPKTNPFHERSLLEMARIYYEQKDVENAYNAYSELAKTATTQEVKEESTVQAGILASQLNKTNESEAILNKAFEFSNDSPWKSQAVAGSISNAYERKDYDRVIALYNSDQLTSTSEALRPRMLLLVGNAHRLKGDTRSAGRLYDLIQSRYSETPEGLEAGFRKIQILYQENNSSLPSAARSYIASVSRKRPDDANIDMANLMLAEYHFSLAERNLQDRSTSSAKANYKYAGEAYAVVREDKIPEKYRSIRHYKQGWAYLESGKLPEGVLAITKFIKRYPRHALTPSALAKRGSTYQAVEDYKFALQDYQTIVKDHPQSSELELAMQQIAFIYGQKRDLPKMIEAFENLLKRFPNTSVKPEATFWIGVGHYDLEDYVKAIPALKAARRMDAANFANRATIRLIVAYYQQENLQDLTAEAIAYAKPDSTQATPVGQKTDTKHPIPRPVLEYLGKKLAKDGDYKNAEFFLSKYVEASKSEEVTVDTWKTLANLRMRQKKFIEAISAWDYYLARSEEPGDLGYGFLQRGKCYFETENYEAAKQNSWECQGIIKQGTLNAEARILEGDSLFRQGDINGAIQRFLIVSQTLNDREITPIALTNLIKAYEKLGDTENAEAYRQELRSKFADHPQPSQKSFLDPTNGNNAAPVERNNADLAPRDNSSLIPRGNNNSLDPTEGGGL